MAGYILKRLISAIPVLLGISVIVFVIMAMIPGDPATAILGSYATPENVAKLNRDLGLDKPMVERYFIWLGNMLTGDFGRSFSLNRPVLDEVLDRFNATLVLAGTSFVLCAIFGVAAGVVSAARQYGLADKAITFAVLIGISIPSFFLGMMMILIFSVNLKWFPVSGMWPIYGARDIGALVSHLTLPAISLAVVATGVVARLSRSAMLEVLRQDFIRTARAKGMPGKSVVVSHMLPAALLPVVSYLGPAVANIVTGAVVVETIFQLPGMGRFFVQGALNRDYPTVLGIVVVFALAVILMNLIVDLLYGLLDPRVKAGR
ncbi:MAG: ABC transporter permease [Rhodobacteraceae bacterium]|nr:ABC transporter permease [Paracoccaceae bacterium]